MICLGIDVAKDKHDCYIVNSDGEILANVFTVPNDQNGFNLLLQKLVTVAPDLSKVKVGLEATGHYSYNILGFLLDKGLHTYVINPLHVNLFRKEICNELHLGHTQVHDHHEKAVAELEILLQKSGQFRT